jgi:hypothetical protein
VMVWFVVFVFFWWWLRCVFAAEAVELICVEFGWFQRRGRWRGRWAMEWNVRVCVSEFGFR